MKKLWPLGALPAALSIRIFAHSTVEGHLRRPMNYREDMNGTLAAPLR